MIRKISIILGLLILLLITISTSCGGGDMRAEQALKYFSKQIEQGNLRDLRLRVYYVPPYIFTLYPRSVDDLIRSQDYIVIDGTRLEEHIDLLKQMSNAALIPVEHETRIDARIYYVFETKKGKKILDVAMWGDDNSIYVNGLEVKENTIFYDVLMPFLPEDEAKELKEYVSQGQTW